MYGASVINQIKGYFNEGYSYLEITHFLSVHHGVILSLRHLKQLLKNLGLKRKYKAEATMVEICSVIIEELHGSGSCLGYKSLWRRLQKTYGLSVKRDTVMKVLQLADPEGISARTRHRLKRRKYVVPGPNFLWHLDGYDKLKPFGFAIHGCVDGYSRRIIWLNVASSNNNPKIIAKYYLDSVKGLQLAPRLLRGDKGTENSIVSSLQKCLRYNHTDRLSGIKSYIEGTSTANQRIESYWCQLRKSGMNWWISYFKDMRDNLYFNDGDQLHIECLRFCYGHLIQNDLHQIAEEWNQHKIRKQKNMELPVGKPNCLFFLPHMMNRIDCGQDIDVDVVDVCLRLYSIEPQIYNSVLRTC